LRSGLFEPVKISNFYVKVKIWSSCCSTCSAYSYNYWFCREIYEVYCSNVRACC